MEFWVMSDDMRKMVEADRARLLAYNDLEALQLSVSDQYQRNKYKGEIESAKWLEEVRRKQAMRAPVMQKVTKGKPKLKIVKDWRNLDGN